MTVSYSFYKEDLEKLAGDEERRAGNRNFLLLRLPKLCFLQSSATFYQVNKLSISF